MKRTILFSKNQNLHKIKKKRKNNCWPPIVRTLLRDHRSWNDQEEKSVNIWREWNIPDLKWKFLFRIPLVELCRAKFHATDRGKGSKGGRTRVVTRGIRLSWHETRRETRMVSLFFRTGIGRKERRNRFVLVERKETEFRRFQVSTRDRWTHIL